MFGEFHVVMWILEEREKEKNCNIVVQHCNMAQCCNADRGAPLPPHRDDRRPLAPFPLAWIGNCFAWTRRKQAVDILVPSPMSLHLRVGHPLSFRSLQRRHRALATATNSPLLLHCSQIHLASPIASPLRTVWANQCWLSLPGSPARSLLLWQRS
jgi:hypothetical protein